MAYLFVQEQKLLAKFTEQGIYEDVGNPKDSLPVNNKTGITNKFKIYISILFY